MKKNAGIKEDSTGKDPAMVSEPALTDIDHPRADDKDDVTIDETIVAMESLLRKINFMLSKRGRSVLREFDLTPPQFVALSHVHHHPELAMSELCQKMQLTNATVTGLVDRLEQKTLVERIRDPEDRRTIRLHTTRLGETLFTKSLQARQRRLAADVVGFSNEEKGQLVALLQRLVESMGRPR
ncbi:MAG: MarR family winged helix-turn-helix transcriptional regulator [Limnochordia bacterium]|jgi:DNA-binding MarR family transcriptional regulator